LLSSPEKFLAKPLATKTILFFGFEVIKQTPTEYLSESVSHANTQLLKTVAE